MKFLEFLKESYSPNSAHIVLQKIVDMIDSGYVEYNTNKLIVNVGKLIKDSAFSDLNLIVRKAKESNVKLGKNKLDDKVYIVIDTNYFPQRQNLHKLFSREEVVTGFEKEFPRYLKTYHKNSETDNKTGHETSKEVNTNKGFENNFKDLEGKIKDKVKEYKAAEKNLKSTLGKSALPSHKASYEAAIEHLKKDSIGSSAKEFVAKMMKLADPKYASHMDNESKKKLVSRLTSYYEQNF